jgi:hypothetical protein
MTAMLVLSLLAAQAHPQLVSAEFLTDQILMLHFDEGRVIYHGKGQKRSDERVEVAPLDVVAASTPGSYTITIASGAKFQPVDVGRKSKGTEFAWFVDAWENGRAVNKRPDHAKEHWIYLFLPSPAKQGSVYKVSSSLFGQPAQVVFDSTKHSSEAFHVNLLGYVPDAPQKFAYVYSWLGDKGSLDLKPYAGSAFRVVHEKTGKVELKGALRFRKAATDPETFHTSDTPSGNFLAADVYECDISKLTKPGRYRVVVDRIGSSQPFNVGADVYRPAFTAVVRALYHNRSGIELKRPYTEFTRPAPHNSKLTPGFAGKLKYSSMRYLDYGSESGTKELIEPTIKGTIESAGWYQDAGDWDSYSSHMRVAQELLLAYELAPDNFSDGELNLPESGNGVPDILDEAAWLPRFCYRLRHELMAKKFGTGGIGLRIAPDVYGGEPDGMPSYEDPRPWIASGEDPVSTYAYAGAAAQLAMAIKRDPEGIDWRKEAVESYDWAFKNTQAKDEPLQEFHARRLYAAAALFALTGEKRYEADFAKGFAALDGLIWLADHQFGPYIYAVEGKGDPELVAKVRSRIKATADASLDSARKRALRWGGNWSFPMLIGHQTTPAALELVAAAKLFTAERAAYIGAAYTTCDYFLGGNSLNMVWISGVGPRFPENAMHLDAWYNGKGRLHPGIVPYGPWRKDKGYGIGPWDFQWAFSTVYPPIDQWPGNERWFNSRYGVLGAEFTIHQNIAPAAAIYGVLCGRKGK